MTDARAARAAGLRLTERASAARRRRFVALAAALLFALSVGACSGGSGEREDQAPTPEPLTAAVVLERAVSAVAGAPSFRFELTHRRGATVLSNGIQVDKATGAAVVPDRYSLDADTRIGRAYFRTQVVVLGEVTYMRNPLADRWDKLTAEESPFGFFNPPALVAGIIGQVMEPALGTVPDSIEGEYVIDGRLPAAALKPLTGAVDEAAVLAVRIRVAADDFLPSSAEITGRATADESDDIVRVIRLWDFGARIELEPPE